MFKKVSGPWHFHFLAVGLELHTCDWTAGVLRFKWSKTFLLLRFQWILCAVVRPETIILFFRGKYVAEIAGWIEGKAVSGWGHWNEKLMWENTAKLHICCAFNMHSVCPGGGNTVKKKKKSFLLPVSVWLAFCAARHFYPVAIYSESLYHGNFFTWEMKTLPHVKSSFWKHLWLWHADLSSESLCNISWCSEI